MCVWPRFSKKWCYKIESSGCLRIPWSIFLHTCTNWLEVCGQNLGFVLLLPFYFLMLFTKIFRHLLFFSSKLMWWSSFGHDSWKFIPSCHWCNACDDHPLLVQHVIMMFIFCFIVLLMYFFCWSSWSWLVGDNDVHLFFFWWC